MRELIKPKKLKQGDTIGVVAPSSWSDPAFIEVAAENLKSRGFNVVMHPQCYARDRGAAGTKKEKVSAIHDFFADKKIDAVFVTRGGSRGLHLIDEIDYALIRSNPKLFMGFSDVTALLSAFYTQAGLVSFHGMTTAGFNPQRNPLTPEKTVPVLTGAWQGNLWPEDYATETIIAGEATGELFGGNLCLLSVLAASGDKYFPSLKGKILVIEDIGEEIRALDRMLGGLRLRDDFRDIAGLVIGQMTDVRDTTDTGIIFDRSFREVLEEHVQGLNIPVVLNAPIGHEHPNIPFPVGIKAKVTAPQGGRPKLELLESPFSD